MNIFSAFSVQDIIYDWWLNGGASFRFLFLEVGKQRRRALPPPAGQMEELQHITLITCQLCLEVTTRYIYSLKYCSWVQFWGIRRLLESLTV